MTLPQRRSGAWRASGHAQSTPPWPLARSCEGGRPVLIRPALLILRALRWRLEPVYRPQGPRRVIDVSFPPQSAFARKRRDDLADALHPPPASFFGDVTGDLVDPDANEVVRRFAADEKRISRQLLKDHADEE